MVRLTLAALSSLAVLATADPVEVLGSKHVAYLSTCLPDECPIGFCGGDDFRILAVGYFADGPPKTSTATPSAIGTLSVFQGNSAWEGDKKNVRISSVGTLTTNIARGAQSLKKTEFAGDAGLAGGEQFVCFRDGSTKYRMRYELERYTCTGEYYCPSTDIGV